VLAEVIGQYEGQIAEKDAEVAAAARLIEAEQKTAERMIGAKEATAAEEATLRRRLRRQSKECGSSSGRSRERGTS
jgi:hypothetical protein